MPPGARTGTVEQNPEVRLSSVIKSARNIMRKDAGLNGDLDRIPQLAWLLFLKAFDDLEEQRSVQDHGYQPVLPEKYRWRTWAHDATERRTGSGLLSFVNDDLLPHLAGMQGSGQAGDPAETLGEVFRETRNRMVSGYLLFDLVGQVDQVDFNAGDDVHTMARVYETMLREVRDAAGDSGEFYTPRPVIRFMVGRLDPQVGEKVLDPAVGTGGFLVEVHDHMSRQVRSAHDLHRVEAGLLGFEKEPLPYLLCQMNMLLHGVNEPQVRRANSLAMEMSDQRRNGVDVVLTNPPFGGEEESRVQEFFRADLRTAETSWLFLQVIMERLERSPSGRAAVVVPNGTLSDRGVGARVKKRLVENFDLHTVVRLPEGVFSPYTPIPSNIIFFEKGRTSQTWFYQLRPPEGRKNYTKTRPMKYEEFSNCEQWWGGSQRSDRQENDHAWTVPVAELQSKDYDLDTTNPHSVRTLDDRLLSDLVAELVSIQGNILRELEQFQSTLSAR